MSNKSKDIIDLDYSFKKLKEFSFKEIKQFPAKHPPPAS